MGVSLTGSSGISMSSLRSVSVVVAAALGVGFYLYGPAITPVMHAAAVSSCNELTGGNFRSYELQWVVSRRPHWNCWDQSAPGADPMDMGWWVSGR